MSPAYGTYRMQLDAPAGATLDIDGNRVLTTTAGLPSQDERVVMAAGVHTLRLQAPLDSAAASVELLWGTDNGDDGAGGAGVPVGRAAGRAGRPGV